MFEHHGIKRWHSRKNKGGEVNFDGGRGVGEEAFMV